MAASIMKVWFFLASQGAQGKRGCGMGLASPEAADVHLPWAVANSH